MSNASAERTLLGALGIDVDPLVVAGGFGKLVDSLLGDGQPFTLAEGLTDGLE